MPATAPRATGTSPHSKTHFAAITGSALALRLAVVLPTLHRDPQWFFTQATELARLGYTLASGKGLSSPFGGDTGPSAFLGPGYPALVALTFRGFGIYSQHAAAALLLLQVLFASATVLCIMLAARKAFDDRTANLAGLIWALSPPLLWLPTLFWESSLSTLLLTAIVAFALHVDSESRRQWPLLGALCAGAMLVNPALLLCLLAIVGWALNRLRSRRLSCAILLLATWAVLFAPWPLRNLRVMHAFIPMRSNLGYELWQGNRAGSDGHFSPDLHPNVNRTEFARYARLGELGYMREKSSIAKADILANPLRFVRLSIQRCFEFWAGLGSRTHSALIVGHIVVTTLLGWLGLIWLWRRHRGTALLFAGPLVLLPLPYYLTHADFRFRLVLDPLLTMLTAYAIRQWMQRRPDKA